MKKDKFFMSHLRRLESWFKGNQANLDLVYWSDLYISEHAVERMIERNLEKDKNFVLGICKWFMQNVFYKTTYNTRTYQISLRGLKCIFYISPGEVIGSRFAVLKTVFESNDDYDVDEKINLK